MIALGPHHFCGFDESTELALDIFARDVPDQFLDRALHGTDYLAGRLRF